jgi:tetratricopeptide (TPR) repeat protein
VLSEPDKDKRKEGLVDFFANLCGEKCPTRHFSLFYTVMHLWKAVFAVSTTHPPQRPTLRTFHWLAGTGMFQSLVRILSLCPDQEFLAVEYNRYVPYRILETIFAAMQAEMVHGDDIIKHVVEDLSIAVPTFVGLMEGRVSFSEQIMAQMVIGNFSCYPEGMILLVNAPHLAGLTGKFLWIAYNLCWVHYGQFDERKTYMHRHLLNTDIELDPGKVYLPGPKRNPDLCAYSALCCMCNICAGYPDECSMEQVDDCLISLVSHGYFWNLGTIATGIHLAQPKYSELTIDKFLSLTSWAGFNPVNQRVILDQINSLPAVRREDPLMFFPTSKCRGRSAIAFLITHALWLDFDQGSHFSILGLMYLLKTIPEVGKAVVDAIGPELVDLAHSIHHVKMPDDGDPVPIKRGIFEPMLRLAGISFYTEQGEMIRNSDPVYKEGHWPECVVEIREYCLRHIREIKLSKDDREKKALLADALKVEGNALYDKGELHSAIEAYTRALDTCPLKCTEKRVTYRSNRSECYLQTDQPRKAIKDCNRALAVNPCNMKVRWRRAQAFQRINYNYPAALDLL